MTGSRYTITLTVDVPQAVIDGYTSQNPDLSPTELEEAHDEGLISVALEGVATHIRKAYVNAIRTDGVPVAMPIFRFGKVVVAATKEPTP